MEWQVWSESLFRNDFRSESLSMMKLHREESVCSLKIGVLIKFLNFTEKDLCWSLFFHRPPLVAASVHQTSLMYIAASTLHLHKLRRSTWNRQLQALTHNKQTSITFLKKEKQSLHKSNNAWWPQTS